MTVSGDHAGYRLAYDAGLQAVDEQASTLRETRDRAGSLMSAAAVAGGLAAGLAFNADRVGGIDAPGAIGATAAVAGIRRCRRDDGDDLAPDRGQVRARCRSDHRFVR